MAFKPFSSQMYYSLNLFLIVSTCSNYNDFRRFGDFKSNVLSFPFQIRLSCRCHYDTDLGLALDIRIIGELPRRVSVPISDSGYNTGMYIVNCILYLVPR